MTDAADGRGVADSDTQRNTARGSLTVSVWTMVSRITGMLRVVVIGAVLGPTYFANAFLSANSVPNLTYTAVAGPVLALVVVPALVRALAGTAGPRTGQANDLLGKISGYLITVAALASGGLAMASPLLALAVTAGIPDPDVRQHAWQLTVLVLLFVAPQVIGYTLAGIGVAAQQARNKFALAAAAPAVENLGLITTMMIFALVYRPGLDVLDISVDMVLLLGIGCTMSVAAHAGMQVIGARRVGLIIRPRRGWRHDPAAVEVTHRLRKSMIVAAFPSASMFAMLAFAATVPGGTIVFQAAMSMYFMIAALGAKSVTVAALPGLSKDAEREDTARFAAGWREALSLSITASLPAACLLIAFAGPVAGVLAHGELHRADILRWLTACLMLFAVAQLANAANETARQAQFARLDVRNPRLISSITLCVRLAVGAASLLLPVGGDRLVCLSLAVLFGEIVAATLGLRAIRAAIRPEPTIDNRRLVQLTIAALTMLPALALGAWLTNAVISSQVLQVIVGLGIGLVALICFGFVLAKLTGQLSTLKNRLRDKLRPRSPVHR